MFAMGHQLVECPVKFFRLHIVGVPSETGVFPSVVRRISARRPTPAQHGHFFIRESRHRQVLGQGHRMKMRIPSGTRVTADIDQPLDVVALEEQKLLA